MSRAKKLRHAVTLFAAIERDQHDALRQIAFDQRKSLAEITREAIDAFIEQNGKVPATQKRAKRTSSRTQGPREVSP